MAKSKKGSNFEQAGRYEGDNQTSRLCISLRRDLNLSSGESGSSQAPKNWMRESTASFVGFSEESFLANAYCVDQVFHETAHAFTDRNEDSTTKEPFKKLLDAIALLFARYKPDKKEKEAAKKCKGLETDHISQHVSAAVMRTPNKTKQYTIYVAKNAGPQVLTKLADTDAAKDTDIPGLLQTWFNSKDANAKDEEFRQRLKDFWSLRLHYYRESIWSKEKEMPQRLAKTSDSVRDFFTSVGGYPVDEDYPLDKDELIRDLDYAAGKTSDVDRATVGLQYHLYRLAYHEHPDVIAKQNAEQNAKVDERSYLKNLDKDRLKFLQLVKDFITYIKHINLENTIDTMMEIFWEFRKKLRQDECKVKIEIHRDCGKYATDLNIIQKIVKSWEDPPPQLSPPGKFGQRRQEVIDSLERLKSNPNAGPADQRLAPRNFHCELQLMDRFLDDLGVSNYIGCSKLSCWLCWQILEGTRFITQSTHGTLHWSCAYPFTKGDSPARKRLAWTFLEVMEEVDDMRAVLLQQGKDYLHRNDALISQTTPLKGLSLDRLAKGNGEREPENKNIKVALIDLKNGASPVIRVLNIQDLSRASAAEQARYLNFLKDAGNDQYLVSQVQISAEESSPGHGRYWEPMLVFTDSETKPGLDVYAYALRSRHDSDGNLSSDWTGVVYLYALFSFQGTATRELMDVEDWMVEPFISKVGNERISGNEVDLR